MKKNPKNQQLLIFSKVRTVLSETTKET